jgi:hypothetical protein
LIRFHYFSGVDSLADVVSEVFRHVFAAANIPAISIGQITAQERQSKAMAAEIVAGISQLRFPTFDAERSQQFCTSVTG